MTTLTPETLAELRRLIDRSDMAEICYACDVMWAFPALFDAAEERDRLRAALIQAGRNAGALLADDVSVNFLMEVPEEVRMKIAAMDERVRELEAQISAARDAEVHARAGRRASFAEAQRYKAERDEAVASLTAELSDMQALRAEDDLSWADTTSENERLKGELAAAYRALAWFWGVYPDASPYPREHAAAIAKSNDN